MDISRVIRQEADWLAKQELSVLSKMLEVYDSTFQELQKRMEELGPESYTANHLQAIQAQVDVLIGEMEKKQSRALGQSVSETVQSQMPREQDYWHKLEKTFGSPEVAKQFSAFTPVIPQKTIKALVTTQRIAIKGFNTDLKKRVRMTVAQSVAQGEGIVKTVKRLQQVQGIQGNKSRLQLIARMETARASNQAKDEFITQVNKEYPELEIWQMVKDRVDKSPHTRNHWFSWAVSGTVRNVTINEYFEVTEESIVFAKQEYTTITKKKAYDHGILFEHHGQGRRGKTIPAHYHDRAILLGWRPTWGLQFGLVKHPQGPIKFTSSDGSEQEVGVMGNYNHAELKNTKNPHSRHYISTLKKPHSDNNTVVLDVPKSLIKHEVREIRAGQAIQVNLRPERYMVSSGRIYGQHNKLNFHPASGPGFVTLNRSEYSALAQIQQVLKRSGTKEEKRKLFKKAVKGQLTRFNKSQIEKGIDVSNDEFIRVMGIVKRHFNVKIKIGR